MFPGVFTGASTITACDSIFPVEILETDHENKTLATLEMLCQVLAMKL